MCRSMASSGRLTVRSSKPAWWGLYTLLPIAIALLVAARLTAPSNTWREIAEGIVSLMVIGAMALRIHANRVALALVDDHQDPENKAHIRERVWLDGVDPDCLEEEIAWRSDIFHA